MASDIRPSVNPKTGKVREKIALRPGFHLMDWMRLSNASKDMSGLNGGPKRKVTLKELSEHKSKYDCWTAYNGKVYNITQYMEYHPGGASKLMLGAGKDCTKLYDRYHKWVNIESIMGKCVVGVLSTDDGGIDEGDEDDDDNEGKIQKDAKEGSEGIKLVGVSEEEEEKDSVGGGAITAGSLKALTSDNEADANSDMKKGPFPQRGADGGVGMKADDRKEGKGLVGMAMSAIRALTTSDSENSSIIAAPAAETADEREAAEELNAAPSNSK